MEFSSSSVMAYILYKAKKAGHPISKTQAQKLDDREIQKYFQQFVPIIQGATA